MAPTERRALVVANGRFDDAALQRLTSPSKDGDELASVLADPSRGRFDVRFCSDLTAADLRREIGEFYGQAIPNELLLFYYSGHGLKDDHDGTLHLCGTDTVERLKRATAVESDYLLGEMNNSIAQQQVVILDCCYSGALRRPGVKSASTPDIPGNLGQVTGGKGRVVLTASNAVQVALESMDETAGRIRSHYSSALIEGLRTGAADLSGDGVVDPFELHRFATNRLGSDLDIQSPAIWAFGVEGAPVISWVGEQSTRSAGDAMDTPETRLVRKRGRRAEAALHGRSLVIALLLVALAVGGSIVALVARDRGDDAGSGATGADSSSDESTPSLVDLDDVLFPETLTVAHRGYWYVELAPDQSVSWSWPDSGDRTFGLDWLWVRSENVGGILPVTMVVQEGETQQEVILETAVVDAPPEDRLCTQLDQLAEVVDDPGLQPIGDAEVTNECIFSLDGQQFMVSVHRGGSAAAFEQRVFLGAVDLDERSDGTVVRRSGGTENFWMRRVGLGTNERVVAIELSSVVLADEVVESLLAGAVELTE